MTHQQEQNQEGLESAQDITEVEGVAEEGLRIDHLMTDPEGLNDGGSRSNAVGFSSPPPPANDGNIVERLALLEDKVEKAISHNFGGEKEDQNHSRGGLTVTVNDSVTMELPESTFSLLVTEVNFSAAYIMAIATACLSMTSLVLALIYSFDVGNALNPLGLPVNVNPIVRAAQYLGVLIGVLMEDEIPQGLELMAITSRSSFVLNDKSLIHKRVIFSSVLRLIVGYMFLIALFVNVVQTDDVLSVFYDVLALQFVESIDDVAFNLAKRGFFGSSITKATQKRHSIQSIEPVENDRGIASNKSWANRFARGVYYLNAVLLIAGLIVITVKQHNGAYRCNLLTVTFEETILEEAYVSNEPRLLIYSYFNGMYEEDGLFDGYPRYREMNKNDGSPFGKTVGAEFVYCKDITAWVFRHEHIRTSLLEEKEHECSWLARSPETQEFDLLSVAESEWSVWTGKVEDFSLAMNCNECLDHTSDCNYHGKCVNKRCVCHNHFGDQCQFDWPCLKMKSKIGYGCGFLSLDGDEQQFNQMYNMPVYMKHNLTGLPTSGSSPENTVAFLLGEGSFAADNEFFSPYSQNMSSAGNTLMSSNYSVLVSHSGSRWLGTIMQTTAMGNFKDSNYMSEFHGFWDRAFKRDSTFIVSEISYEGSPVNSDFFEMRHGSKGEETGHGPYGVLVPLLDLEGSGFFSCLSENDCYDSLVNATSDLVNAANATSVLGNT